MNKTLKDDILDYLDYCKRLNLKPSRFSVFDNYVKNVYAKKKVTKC